MTVFWSAFWPSLAATIVGIAVGLPLALWINRHAMAHGERQRRLNERNAVAHALAVLETAITENRKRLQRFANVLAENKTLFDTGLDAATWEAVQAALTAELRDPDRRQRLAYHFSRLAAVVKLNDLYVRFAVGVESALSGASEAKKGLGATLRQAVSELEGEAPDLVNAISQAREQLAPRAAALALTA